MACSLSRIQNRSITEDGHDDEKVRTRLNIIRTVFNNLKGALRDRKMKLELPIEVLKCDV